MPYVLQNGRTGEIYACAQVNHYNLSYFGVKYWEEEEEARSNAPSFLQSQGVADPDVWQPLEIPENRVKICNVKLKNDPANHVYLENGVPVVRQS